MLRGITRTVWVLSLVSFFTDTASEMLYPILPIYLKSIGFSVILIGILEGIAEAAAGLSKGYFGKLSDTAARRAPFVQAGYALSALAKPLMAVFTWPLWVFMARTIDRFGKGIRTGARDAILSDEATPQTKGAVFGFHRSMDTLGAVVGPVFALIYLYFNPGSYRMLFFIAFIPGLLAVVASVMVRDKKVGAPKGAKAFVSPFSFLRYWQTAPADYRRVVAGLLVFTLINSSDVFLLLRAKEMGLDDTWVVGVYIFYNLVYALFAYPMGILADRLGIRTVFIAGITFFAAVYMGMGLNGSNFLLMGLFFLYGIYAAATEGISKAWISNIVHKGDVATAIGTFTAFQSLCTLVASSLTGIIWFTLGARVAFFTIGTLAALVVGYFLLNTSPVGTRRRVSSGKTT